MPPRRTGYGRQLLGSIGFDRGDGKFLSALYRGTVSLNPGSIAATTRVATTFAVAGILAATDVVVMNPPATLNDDLIFVGAAVTADGTVTVWLYNPTAGAIDDGALTWKYVILGAG